MGLFKSTLRGELYELLHGTQLLVSYVSCSPSKLHNETLLKRRRRLSKARSKDRCGTYSELCRSIRSVFRREKAVGQLQGKLAKGGIEYAIFS